MLSYLYLFSVFSGDLGQFIKIAHEISHAWFGIMIGSLDWTEAWISEGFATFLEEVVHDEVLAMMRVSQIKGERQLRSYLKYQSLVEEFANTSSDLQKLQPLEGKSLKTGGQEFVRNGLNPVAGMTQAHYLKGYFLLHYLLQVVGGSEDFFSLLKVDWKLQTHKL